MKVYILVGRHIYPDDPSTATYYHTFRTKKMAQACAEFEEFDEWFIFDTILDSAKGDPELGAANG